MMWRQPPHAARCYKMLRAPRVCSADARWSCTANESLLVSVGGTYRHSAGGEGGVSSGVIPAMFFSREDSLYFGGGVG